MIPDGWKMERLQWCAGAILLGNGNKYTVHFDDDEKPLTYQLLDALLKQTESTSEAAK